MRKIDNAEKGGKTTFGFFCNSKKKDILSKYQPGDILECLENSLLHKLRA